MDDCKFKRWLLHPAPLLWARLFVAWIFIAAAWQKIVCPEAFSVSIAAYRLVPDAVVNLMAVVIPWAELAIGAGLALGVRTRGFGTIASLLMLVFIAAVTASLAMGVTAESCGCNVPGFSEELGVGTVVRDVFFLVLCIYIVLAGGGAWSVDGLSKRRG